MILLHHSYYYRYKFELRSKAPHIGDTTNQN